jgi:hypothetical protein
MTQDELVSAYWRHYGLSNSDERTDRLAADDQFWAWEQVDRAARAGEPGIVDLLVSLSEAAPDDAAREYLGAGPVEDLVRLHTGDLGAEIEKAARQSQGFATALHSIR